MNNRYYNEMKHTYSITSCTLHGGKKDGTKVHIVKTGSGLEYVVNEDRCLDIPSLTFKGVNISYQGREGIINSKYCERNVDNTFNSYYPGGMLYTCGLKNVGPSSSIDNVFYQTHGLIGTYPANKVCLSEDDKYLTISGETSETSLFGSNLSLKRTIKSRIMKNEIEIDDVITNYGNKDEIYYILYHMNLGYPFLDEYTKLISKTKSIIPRDEYAKKYLDYKDMFISPKDDIEESVFFRDMEDENGISKISAINEKLGIKFSIEYENRYLPNLVQWFSPIRGDYALGLEPTNTLVKGREEEIKSGNSPIIKKGESINIRLKISLEEI